MNCGRTTEREHPDSNLTLAEHAEAWARQQGRDVPPRETPEWQRLYEEWHAFAFKNFTP